MGISCLKLEYDSRKTNRKTEEEFLIPRDSVNLGQDRSCKLDAQTGSKLLVETDMKILFRNLNNVGVLRVKIVILT